MEIVETTEIVGIMEPMGNSGSMEISGNDGTEW